MYSADLRKAALHLYGIVRSIRKASALLQVGRSTIARWVQTGGVRKPYKRRYSKTGATVDFIRETLVRQPFISSHELASAIRTTLDISVSKELVRAVICKTGFTQKKAKFFGRPTGVDQKTHDFIQSRNAMLASGHMFASIDETSFGRHAPAVHGWAPRGQPLFVTRKPARITTTSMLTVCLQDGRMLSHRRTGSFNTVSFREALGAFNLPAGTFLLLDNVSFHHSKVVKDYAVSHGIVLLYVPPYSPWFNPVEGVFSVAQRSYYQHGSIDRAMQAVTPSHVKSFFRHALALQSAPTFSTI